MHALTLLWEFGLHSDSNAARQAGAKVRDNVHWIGWDLDGQWHGENHVGAPYFAGEVEPCINGQVAAAGAYFRQDVGRIIDRLLREQLPDGGWNCEAERGSTRSSFNTTICVLEALLEHERASGPTPAVTAARLRGQEYLLERRLFRRRSTGEFIEHDRKCGASFTRFAFPTWWHYDVLRALDYLRSAGVTPDERLADAVELVESQRPSDRRWLAEAAYPGKMPVDLGETEGHASRWITLRAMRVLKWFK
jgi:hypothetical protein